MTASVQVSPVTTAPITTAALADNPLSIRVADYAAAIASGATPVDIRSHRKRAADGALFGALAIEPTEILDLLTPGLPTSLRIATPETRWILISDDGHEAEWLTWHLQARGVIGAVFAVGGFTGLRRAGIHGAIREHELAMFSAH